MHERHHCVLSFFEHTGFVGGNHVLDVDEGIWSASFFQYFQSFLDQITHILVEPLMVVNGITNIQILVLENVENRKELSVIRHQSLSNKVSRSRQLLKCF